MYFCCIVKHFGMLLWSTVLHWLIFCVAESFCSFNDSFVLCRKCKKCALEVLFCQNSRSTFKKGSCNTVLSLSSFRGQKIQAFESVLTLSNHCSEIFPKNEEAAFSFLVDFSFNLNGFSRLYDFTFI